MKKACFPGRQQRIKILDYRTRAQLSVARCMSLKDKRACFMQMRSFSGDFPHVSLIYSKTGLSIGTIAVAHVVNVDEPDIGD